MTPWPMFIVSETLSMHFNASLTSRAELWPYTDDEFKEVTVFHHRDVPGTYS